MILWTLKTVPRVSKTRKIVSEQSFKPGIGPPSREWSLTMKNSLLNSENGCLKHKNSPINNKNSPINNKISLPGFEAVTNGLRFE